MRCMDRITRCVGASITESIAILLAGPSWSRLQGDAWTSIAAAPCASAGNGPPVLARGLSAQASSSADQSESLPTLKSALRSLYKRVHPDLFAEHPAEQAENDRSFKLLQEYLQQARSGDPLNPAARTPYHFVFYIRQEQQQAQQRQQGQDTTTANSSSSHVSSSSSSSGSGTGSSSASLHRVELSLPPPERSMHGANLLSATARKALGRLLAQCGLPSAFAEGAEEAAAQQLLTNFLPEAAEAVRQQESGSASAEVLVANLRGAMRLARQVVVGFGGRHGLSGSQQVELLQRLANVLEEFHPEELAGLHILLGHRTALDSQGNLWLDANEPPESWADFLGGVDVEYALQRRATAGAVRALERSVAAAAGLAMVYTTGNGLMAPEYRVFLERLAAHAAQHGPVGAGTHQHSQHHQRQATTVAPFRQLPLCVADASSTHGHGSAHGHSPQGSHSSTGFAVDEHMGSVQVPVAAQPWQVYGFVQDHGGKALQALKASRRRSAELGDFVTNVRQRVRLQRLMRDEAAVSEAQFRAFCKRLLHHREELQQWLDGLSIRVVAGSNRVRSDGVVEVKWNFDV